jgi:hypothetical protein
MLMLIPSPEHQYWLSDNFSTDDINSFFNSCVSLLRSEQHDSASPALVFDKTQGRASIQNPVTTDRQFLLDTITLLRKGHLSSSCDSKPDDISALIYIAAFNVLASSKFLGIMTPDEESLYLGARSGDSTYNQLLAYISSLLPSL